MYSLLGELRYRTFSHLLHCSNLYEAAMKMWKIISLVLLLTVCKACARRGCETSSKVGDYRFVSLSNGNLGFDLRKAASVYVSANMSLEGNVIKLSLNSTSVKLFYDGQLISFKNGSYVNLAFSIWYKSQTLYVADEGDKLILSHTNQSITLKYFAYNHSMLSCFHEDSEPDNTESEEPEHSMDVASTYHSPTTSYVSDKPTNCTCLKVPCICANNLNESLVYECLTWSCNCSWDNLETNTTEECNCTAIMCETCQSIVCGIIENEIATGKVVASQTQSQTTYDNTFTETNRNTEHQEDTSNNQSILQGSTQSGEHTSSVSSQMQTTSSQTGSDGYSAYSSAVFESTTSSAINKEGGGSKYSTTVLILTISTGALVLAFVIGCICVVAGLIRKPKENKVSPQ
ncbi:uncharacterized protein LOC117116927 isoform X2 [Anneissia japonica]|uniref:uncharacterized protein LOC117116927 isoform X2 n=1 Tax=Anneissia japonica TaxID=1529436 RepID=UPI001425A1F6|nr:uncharacterized protein LOC117116927 isoform X2 [Anneissia japonica]